MNNGESMKGGRDQGLPGKRVLVVGASGDLGLAVLSMLERPGMVLGAHYFRRRYGLTQWKKNLAGRGAKGKLFQADLRHQKSCHDLVRRYVRWAGGIDVLVQLTGNVQRPVFWNQISEKEWNMDLATNLSGPFFLAQSAMAHMGKTGGRIVLTSTASAKHGGGGNTLAYGVAKAGVECLIKGLARAGAPNGILVNGVAPGFIPTSFHTDRLKRTSAELKKRAQMTLLKRAGRPEDVAHCILYLLSEGGNYITGECISVSGGDWL